jgi:hypothetical protein
VIYAEKLKRAFSRLDKRFIHHSILFGAKLPISALVTPLSNRRRQRLRISQSDNCSHLATNHVIASAGLNQTNKLSRKSRGFVFQLLFFR